MPLNAADLEDLRRARELLENPGLAMKVTNVIGLPVEKAFEILPRWLARIIGGSTRALLRAALAVACWTFTSRRTGPSRDPTHKVLVATSGAVGGLFGIAGLPIELPISTALMLRSIADVARSEGEDVESKETREACIQVFALGGRSKSDDAAETGYFAARAILARAIGEAAEFVAEKGIVQEGAPVLVRLLAGFASRSSVAVSEKALLQAVPLIGAAGGATVNLLFMAHFQRMARGHFVVRRLERRYGQEEVRRAYEGRVTAVVAPPKLLAARTEPPRIG